MMTMLLLTMLVGGTAYSLSKNSQSATTSVIRHATEAVLINNIRWHLIQVRDAADTATAKTQWQEAQQEVTLLQKLNPRSDIAQQLHQLTAVEKNRQHLAPILASPLFSLKLDRIDEELDLVQQYTRQVTTIVTFSMFFLGLLLMGITARDLSRLINELIRARDLNDRLQEEERRRIAQDLHDGVVQELIDLKRAYAPEKVDRLVDNIRRVCHNLKPQVLEDLGLPAALEFLAEDLRESTTCEVKVILDRDELAQLPKPYTLPLFRVVQELFSNVRRHARASKTQFTLVYDPDTHQLRGYMQDNGQGFDLKTAKRGLGLSGIQERVRQLGGRITIETAPGQGSRCQFVIPVDPESAVPDELTV